MKKNQTKEIIINSILIICYLYSVILLLVMWRFQNLIQLHEVIILSIIPLIINGLLIFRKEENK